MPGDVAWELHGDRAALLCDGLHAVVDVRQPARGLHDLSLDQRRFADCQFLGVAIDAEIPAALADSYTRGGDLIVRYAQTGARPFGVGVYWRAGVASVGSLLLPRVDLVVSVETNLLDSRPELEAQTWLAMPAEASRPANGCLARFPQLGLSYLELAHPGDALAPLFTRVGAAVRLTTRLFGQPLERGVILRSRLRGVFAPLSASESLAADALAQFAAAAPPLTT
ncbi:MAG TPA: hypothetical protein VG125_31875 [Pirellulales bacterium]|jgi:hypothetical protein|nr:hypothetical protein [Pirellulales bacterium]